MSQKQKRRGPSQGSGGEGASGGVSQALKDAARRAKEAADAAASAAKEEEAEQQNIATSRLRGGIKFICCCGDSHCQIGPFTIPVNSN